MVKTVNISRLFFYLFAFSTLVGYLSITLLDMAWGNVMRAITFAIFIHLFFNKGNKKIIVPKYAKFFLLFIIYVTISDFFIAERSVFTINYLYTNSLYASFALFIIIENSIFSKKFLNAITKILTVFIIIAFLVTIIQSAYDISFFINPIVYEAQSNFFTTEARLPSIYSWTSPLDLGLSFVPTLMLISAKYVRTKSKIIYLLLIVGIIVVFLSKSRWVMINYLLLIIMIIKYRKINFRSIFTYIIGLPLVLFISLQLFEEINVDVNKIIDTRILQTNSGGILEGSAATRILAFYAFAELYPDKPVFGRGNQQIGFGDSEDNELAEYLGGQSSQIHVGYLSLFYRYGFIGGLLFLFFLYNLTKRTYRTAKQANEWGPFFGLLCFIVANLTLVYFDFFLMGLIFVLVFEKHYRDKLKKTKLKLDNKLHPAGNVQIATDGFKS